MWIIYTLVHPPEHRPEKEESLEITGGEARGQWKRKGNVKVLQGGCILSVMLRRKKWNRLPEVVYDVQRLSVCQHFYFLSLSHTSEFSDHESKSAY